MACTKIIIDRSGHFYFHYTLYNLNNCIMILVQVNMLGHTSIYLISQSMVNSEYSENKVTLDLFRYYC